LTNISKRNLENYEPYDYMARRKSDSCQALIECMLGHSQVLFAPAASQTAGFGQDDKRAGPE